MSKTLRYMGKSLQVLAILLLAALLAANIWLFAMEHISGKTNPALFGWSSAIVVSGSMEPALSVDDLLLIHQEADYSPGDIITFQSSDSLVTHRIIAEGPEGFVTQGDANNTADTHPVAPEQITGRVVAAIPGVGLVIGYLKTPMGLISLALVGGVLLMLPAFVSGLGHGGNDREDDHEKDR